MSIPNPEKYALLSTTGNVTYFYPYNSPSYPQYRQNYLEGNIDSSIWLFEYSNSIYSPYTYITNFALEGTTATERVVRKEVFNNRINKKLWRPAYNLYNAGTSPNGNINSLWFPNGVSPSCNCQFVADYDYGNTCFYPIFQLFDPTTQSTINNVDYLTAETNYSNYLITRIELRTYVGTKGTTTGRAIAYNLHPYSIYSGNMLGFNTSSIIDRNNYSGSFYFGGNIILELGNIYYQLKANNTYSVIKTVIPYDVDAIAQLYTYETQSQIITGYGVTLEMAGYLVTALGHYWAKTLQSAQNSELGARCTDPNITCARIGKNNKIQFNDPSDAISGTAIAETAIADPESNFNWGSGAEDKNGKDIQDIEEQINPDNAEETEETELNENTYSTAGAFNTAYAMTEENVNFIAQWLWNGSPDLSWDSVLVGLTLMGGNPINAIISLKAFPFNLNNVADTGSYETIYVGKESSGIMARPIHKTTIIIDMGNMFYDVGDNLAFLNYEPYASCNLYIPYCGILSLSPTEVIGKDINVKLIVDLITGTCTGVVFIDNIAYAYKDGIISIDVPVTGTNMSQYFSNLVSSTMSGTTTGMSAGGKMNEIISSSVSAPVTVGVGGAIGAVAGAIAGQAKGVTISKSGASTPACALAQPQYCYLIFETPTEIEWLSNYGHTNGFLSFRTGTIISLQGTGFSIFENVDCSGISGATENEKEEIKKLLESGIYL